MPSYDFRCTKCDTTFEVVTVIAKRNEPLDEPCPECESSGTVERLAAAPFIGDPVRQGVKKTDAGWRETLARVKQHHPKATFDPDRY